MRDTRSSSGSVSRKASSRRRSIRPRRLYAPAIGAALAIAVAMIPLLIADWRSLEANRHLSATIDEWQEGERRALALLVIYVQTESPADFGNFEAAIGRSVALRPVRRLLSAEKPDPNDVAQRLLMAGREPVEVAGFVATLEPMLALEELPSILSLWKHGDTQIDGILELAYHLRREVSGRRRPSVAEALLQIRSASGDLQTTAAELKKQLLDSGDRQRLRLIGHGVVASLLALAPGALLFAFTIRRGRRVKSQPGTQPGSLIGDADRLSYSAMGVWHRDLDGETLFANATLLALFGADAVATVRSRFEWDGNSGELGASEARARAGPRWSHLRIRDRAGGVQFGHAPLAGRLGTGAIADRWAHGHHRALLRSR